MSLMEGCQSPVEWNSLENCRRFAASVGSNPTPSSIETSMARAVTGRGAPSKIR